MARRGGVLQDRHGRRRGDGESAAGIVKYSIGRGVSQSGNFVRGWLHLGFNRDEAGRQAHDGRWPIIAGRRIALNEVLIHAEAFPGWENFAGLAAHIRFVRNHYQKIERVALATDSPVARVAEALANHFTAADIKRFPFANCEKALGWLKKF